MISMKNLLQLSNVDLKEVRSDDLSNLLDVTITGETPMQRLESYLEQIKNPYLFQVDGIVVKVSFSGEKSLEHLLKNHFLALKQKEL